MAGVPYKPFAEIAPSALNAPSQRIPVSSDMFGGAGAQALQQGGNAIARGASDVSEFAVQQQVQATEARVNEVQAKYLESLTGYLYKPASAADKDDGGFYTKRGDNALSAYGTPEKGAIADLNSLRAQFKGQLVNGDGTPNERQQNMFDALTRRTHALTLGDMGRYTDREVAQAQDKKTEALLAATGQQATLAAFAANMDLFKEAIDQGSGAAKGWGHAKGLGAEWGEKYSQRWVGQTVLNAATQKLQVDDTAGASMLLASYRQQMDPASVVALQTKLKGVLEDKTANDYARSAVYGAMEGAPALGDVTGRIIQIEGTGKNPASSAEGTGQFINSTWLETVRATRPDLADKPDDELLEMRKDPELAKSMVQNYAASNAITLQNANLEPSPGNLYLAHFLGPTGAVKVLSADPTSLVSEVISPQAIAANPMLKGKTAGEVAQWGNSQMAGIKPTAAVKIQKAETLAQADKVFGSDPNMLRKVHAAINRTYTSVQTAAAAAEAERTAANENAADGYVKKMIAGDYKTIVDDIANDKSLTYQTREHLWKMAEQRVKSDTERDEKTYGPGFWTMLARVNLPAGAEGRLTDPTSLYAAAEDGKVLTISGVDKLTQIMRGKRTVEGESSSKMQSAAIAYAKNLMSFEVDYGTIKIPDPAGMARFNSQFIPAFYKAYAEGKDAGKSDYDLLSKDSKDYIVDKLVSVYKRTPAQETADRMQAGIDAETGGAAGLKPLAIGEERDGWRFKGGNPAQAASWEKVVRPPIAGLSP